MIEITTIEESALIRSFTDNLVTERFRRLKLNVYPIVFGINVSITLNGSINQSALDISDKTTFEFVDLGIAGESYSPVIVITHPTDSELDETITLPDVNVRDILELYFENEALFISLVSTNLDEFGVTAPQKQKIAVAFRKSLAQYTQQEIVNRKAELDTRNDQTKAKLDEDVILVDDVDNT